MNSKRIFAALMIVLSLCLLVTAVGTIVHNQSDASAPASEMATLASTASVGSVPLTGMTLGNSSAIFTVTGGAGGTTASGTFNFATGTLTTTGTGTAATSLTSSSGTGTTPISDTRAWLSLSGGTATNVLLGSSSSSCTFPLYPTATSGTAAGNFMYSLPQVSNLSQAYFKLTNSGTTTCTADIELIYNK